MYMFIFDNQVCYYYKLLHLNYVLANFGTFRAIHGREVWEGGASGPPVFYENSIFIEHLLLKFEILLLPIEIIFLQIRLLIF